MQIAALLFLLAGLLVLMSFLTRGKLLETQSLQAIAFQLPLLGLLTLAQMGPMVSGGIDLSIIATANLVSIIMALSMTRFFPSFRAPFAILLGLSLSLLLGMVKGFFVALVSVPAIIATLGLMIFIRGVSLVITRGYVIAGFPRDFLFIGNGTVLGVPTSFIIFAALAVFLYLLFSRTRFGLELYLFGSNPVATLFAGVDNRKIVFRTYLLSSLLAGVASCVMASRFNAAQADYGESYLLLTVLACVLGGVSPSGGSGKVLGVAISVTVLQIVATGFNLLGFSSHLASALWGAILLGVVLFNRLVFGARS